MNTCQLLLDRGARNDQKDHSKLTPLRYAVAFGRVDVCRLFLDRGANVDGEGDFSESPLLHAVWRGEVEMCKLLFSRGAHITNGVFLKSAAGMGHLCVCALLLEQGATVHETFFGGETCFHRAVRAGHLDVACLLLKHGADMANVDGNGKTALALAKEGKHAGVVAMLSEYKGKKAAGASVQVNKRKREAGNVAPTPIYDSIISLVDKVIGLETECRESKRANLDFERTIERLQEEKAAAEAKLAGRI